jgi:hypothetical protein
MLLIDDRLPTHPKILKAGQLLGNGGVSQAFHMYVMGLAYARQNLTDGFIPDGFVLSCGAVSKSSLCAKALSARGIGLWRKVHGGYQIHDFHRYNPKASDVKEKRERDRLRKQAERHGRNGSMSEVDISRTRARAVPITKVPSVRADADKKSTSTDAARRSLTLAKYVTQEVATFALACVVMREAFALAGDDRSVSNVGEHFKELCARRGLAYDGVLVRKAFDAVQVARARRSA